MTVVGDALIVAGALFVLVAAIGLMRLATFAERIHPATKSATLGMLLTAGGAMVHLWSWRSFWPLLLVSLLILLTAPVAAHLLGRASYFSAGLLRRPDGIDELAGDADVQE